MADDHPGGLTREHVVWAYRLLLDRDPESDEVIGPKLAGSRDTRELRRHLMTSAEFQKKNRDYAHTNDSTVVWAESSGQSVLSDAPSCRSLETLGETGRQDQKRSMNPVGKLAVRQGFEPWVELWAVQRFSKPPPSASRPPHRMRGFPKDFANLALPNQLRPG